MKYLLSLLLLSSPALADTTLLTQTPGVRVSANQRKIFERNKNHKATVAIEVAKLNIKDIVGGSGVLAFPVLIELNAKTHMKMENCDVVDEKDYLRISWKSAGNLAIITINKADNTIFAYIIFKDKLYVVEPLGNGLAMVMQVDQTKFPKD
jgi:hypothetical protein